MLALSNIGGKVDGIPVDRKVQKETVRFVMSALSEVPPELSDPGQQQRILDELVGYFLPERVVASGGKKALKSYYRQLRKYRKRLPLKNEKDWLFNN